MMIKSVMNQTDEECKEPMQNTKKYGESIVLGIFGASGLGREFLETAKQINKDQRYEKIIFIDDNPELVKVQGIPVYSFNNALSSYGNHLHIAVAIGEPATRRKIIERISNNNIEFETLIHPCATIPESTSVGKGCYIGSFVFISCNVNIENYVLIQPYVTVGHDCRIGNNVILSSRDTLSGNVQIGDDTYIGIQVPIIQGAQIGSGSIVGMGSVVTRDIPDDVIALGNPARAMKKNENHKVF